MSQNVRPAVQPILFTRKDSAYMLSMSLRQLDYMIANGQIRVHRNGRTVKIHRNELKRFAAGDRPSPGKADKPDKE